MGVNGLRNAAIVAFFVSMAILFVGGYYANDKKPPIPSLVVVGSEKLTTGAAIRQGQNVYQRYGLMDHGSVWGHGTLRGMDFSADTLHRAGQDMRDYLASQIEPRPAAGEKGSPKPEAEPRRGAYGKLPAEQQWQVETDVIHQIRTNRYDHASRTLQLTPAQAYAFQENRAYWERVFHLGEEGYGFLPDTVSTPDERRDIADFFFWTAWAAGTNRIMPDAKQGAKELDYSYTNNWPADRSVGNMPTAAALVWSIASILALFVVLGLVIYTVHRYQFFYGEARAVEASYRLLQSPVTPSQRASAKFFLVAGLLFVVQIFNGGLLAHYTVHPGTFYIQYIAQIYPYSWAKSWHLQLAILWIAVSWMGTAVYLAPLVAGREPPRQRLLVNILFIAAVVVAVGSLLGEVLGIKGYLGPVWFLLGHQGWEYLELGKLWQILLFGGLIFWLVVVYRAMVPALTASAKDDQEARDRRALMLFYVMSAIFVVAFFGFGLVFWPGTHLTIADYWRWFVVHIWVESIFEFFGVGVISLFLVTLGLVTARSALRVAYLTAILIFLSGIPGTAHHYFWYGGPGFWLAIGGVFSSLEPIPLILLVVRAWMEYRSIRAEGREFPYRWPLYFLTASSAWNFLGAGVFGFIINLPIINYYEHATYLTVNHAHTALFGVYGMLAIALILFSWRGLIEDKHWKDGLLKLSFWGLNGGLFLMFLTTLLPVGFLQVWESYTAGLWSARSAEFYDRAPVKFLGQSRMFSDMIIIVLGAFPLLYFLLSTFPRLRQVESGGESAEAG